MVREEANQREAKSNKFGLIFTRYVPLGFQSPYPIIEYSVANYRPHLTFRQTCNFGDPSAWSLSIYVSTLY